jgi:CheY-like chemotaxis protein
VDDNATNRRILREQLLSFGCAPQEVSSAKEALVVLAESAEKRQPFRVAILDMQMPEMDGEQLGLAIRDDHRFDDMPMILYTSMGDHGGPEQMRDKGFSVVLMKPTRQSHILNAILTVLGEQESEHVADEEKPEDTRELAGLQVLLAEDNEINQMVAMMMLERFGCQTVAVGTGKLAVEELARNHYDVVLMDVHMPEMDGYMATAAIREFQAPLGKHTPVIAMTAKAMTGDRELCLAAGMDDYIVKPVRPDDLHAVLVRWSSGRHNTV